MSEYGPQDPRILIGKRYGCLLPPRPVSKLGDPLRNRVGSSVSRKYGRASRLDQQHPQVRVAALRYASERRLSATGTLPRRQAEPGPELRATPELLEVTHS